MYRREKTTLGKGRLGKAPITLGESSFSKELGHNVEKKGPKRGTNINRRKTRGDRYCGI